MSYAKQSANAFNRDALEQISRELESILRYYPDEENHRIAFENTYLGIQRIMLLQD